MPAACSISSLIAIKMARAEVEGIKREAGIERESRIAVLFIVIFGSVFALLALFAQLMALKSEHGFDRDHQHRAYRLRPSFCPGC